MTRAHRLFLLSMAACLLLAAGCAERTTTPPEPMVVRGVDYDTVFDAVRDEIGADYDLMVQDREAGIVSTAYRIDPTLLEYPAQDSRSFYRRLESTLHLIRHRVAAGVTEGDDGAVRVVVTAYRQRQAYRAPTVLPIRQQYYAVMDDDVGGTIPVALEGPQRNWENLPDNHDVAIHLYSEIERAVRKRRGDIERPAEKPAGPSGFPEDTPTPEIDEAP